MQNTNCLFCKIIQGTIPSAKVFENEKILGFKDLHPQAQSHFLFIHKNHTRDINDLMMSDPTQLEDIFKGIKDFSQAEGLEKSGFRVVTNLGPHGGQTVFHTHFHLLGGETLRGFGR